MTTIPVLIEDWQHECCGDPTCVGTEVTLMLQLTRPDRVDGLDGVTVTLDGPRERRESDGDPCEVAVLAGAEVALVAHPDPWPVGPATGLLVDESHGSVPVTLAVGHVRRIRVLTRERRRTRWRKAVVDVPGSARAHPVDRVPDSFGFWPPGTREADPAGQAVAIGALLDVELTGETR